MVSDAMGLKYSQEIVWPTDLYAFQHLETGPIDVALIGSSRTTFGLTPTAIDACLANRLGRETTTYNLARVFASMETERSVAHDLLVGPRIPKIAVVEIAPEILAARHHEHTYNTASQVDLSGVPGCLTSARSADDLVACSRAPLRGVENIAWLLSGERADINHLNWMMIHQRGGQFCFGSPVCEAHNQRFKGPLQNRWQMRIDRILPTLTEDRFGDWRIGSGQGHDALLALIAESQARGYDLLLVNMPVHQVYMDEVPPEDYAAYLAYIDDVSTQHGVPVFDANTVQWNSARDRFDDP
ncbi:MAG: hypothetical protein ACI8RZ_003533, partial [Myxococcota bacterium]